MQLEAHEAGPSSDIYCVNVVFGSFAGYVEELGIEEEAVPIL